MRLVRDIEEEQREGHFMTTEARTHIEINKDSSPLVMEPLPTYDVPLTTRELEALGWTMEGKTAWEVGEILGISEQTAVRHLNNATRKLDCVNKHHAVVKAMRLGLLR
jgi:DNA-binding CsgD family transcriptional regulator